MISFGPVELVPTEEKHLVALWKILSEWPRFWEDRGKVTDYWEFHDWFYEKIKNSLTGLDNGEVVGFGFLDQIYPGYYATIGIVKKKGYLNPKMIAAIAKDGLHPLFEKHDLEKIVGIVREDHKASIRLLKKVGFKITGRLRHHAKINGEWKDYIWSEILREEL